MYKPNADVRSSGTTLAPTNFAAPTYAMSPMEAAFNAASQTINNSDAPLYGYEQYTPYEMTKRYMTGSGHTGYIGLNSSEDYNAQMQSNWSKAINGTMKGLGVAGTSFIDGTLGTVVGLLNMASTGEFHKFFDNPVTNKMEEFRNLTEEWAPNYYTDVEQNAEWYSMDNWFKTNFLFDKLIKNAGFAAAAIGEGYLVGKLLQKLTQATVLGKLPQAVSELEQGLSAVNQGQKATQVFDDFGGQWLKSYIEKPVSNMTAIESLSGQAAKVQKATNNFINKTASVFATTAEANAEALQGYRRIKEDLIQEYKDAHKGEHPTGDVLKEIDERAAQGGNVRFGMNVLTLGISNMIQFPRLLNGAMSAEKGTMVKEINDVVVDKTGAAVAKAGQNYVTKASLASTKQKVFDGIAKKLGVVQLSEGAEEGMQYAIEEGIHEYEMMAKDPRAMGAIGNIFNEGLGKTFNSKEGMESIMLGVLTGGLMNSVTNFGKGSKIRGNTKEFLDQVNTKPQAGALVATYNNEENSFASEMLRSVARGFTAQAEKEEGHAEGDMVKVKDADAKAFMAYALPRIKFGRYQMIIDELDQYRNRPFDEVRAELGLPENVTQEDINKRIEGLKQKAQIAKNLYEAMSMRFAQAVTMKDGKPVKKYSDKDIDELVYKAYRVSDYERRFNELERQVSDGLSKAKYQGDYGVDALFDKDARIDDQGNEKDLEEIRTQLYKQLDSISPELQQDKNGMTYAEKLRDLERIQNKREDYLYQFEDLKNQDIMDLDAFDVEGAKVDDYLKYERLSKGRTILNQLDKNTERRPITYELEKRIKDAMETPGKTLEEVIQDIKDTDTFLYNETKPQIQQFIAKELAARQQRTQAAKDRMDELDPMDPMDMAEMSKLEQEIPELEAAETKFAKFQEDMVPVETEPTIGNENQLRRKLADSFTDKADVFLTGAEKDPEYGDEKTVSAIDKLIAQLKNLKKIFTDRKDGVPNTKEFKGFAKVLDEKIEALEKLAQAIKERVADREVIQKKAIESYGEIKILGAGYDVKNDKITSQALYDFFKNLIGETQFKELLQKAKDTKDLYWSDIIIDHINEKATDAQKEELKAIIAKEQERLQKELSESEFFKAYQATAVGNKRFVKDMLENPAAFVKSIITAVSYNFRNTTDNPLGRYVIKHGNTRLLQEELEKEGGSYNDVGESIPAFLEMYHQLKALKDLQDAANADVSQYDIYVKLELQVDADKAKGLPVPTHQQLLAIREAIVQFYRKGDYTAAFEAWSYLEGVIGAGKTSIFGRYLLNTLSNLEKKSISDIAEATADLKGTADNINQALGLSTSRPLNEVIDSLNDNSFNKELLIVDEFARIGKEAAEKLAEAVAQYNTRNNKQVRVLAIGDQSQIREISFISGLPTSVRHLNPLTISYRSSVNAIADIQQRFKSKGQDVSQEIVTESNFADPKAAGTEPLYGVHGGNSKEGMLDVIASRPDTVSKMIIVDEGKKAEWDALVASKGLTGKVEVMTAREAQGKTRDEVYLWLEKDPKNDTWMDFNTRIYTSARGKNFIYLGGMTPKVTENKQIVSGVTKNDNENNKRSDELVSFLNDGINAFEEYFEKEPDTTQPVTTNGINLDQQEKEVKEEKQIEKDLKEDEKTEETEEEKEYFDEKPGSETKIEVNSGTEVVIIDKGVDKSSSFKIRFPSYKGLKKSAGLDSNDTTTHEFKAVPVKKMMNGKSYVKLMLFREFNGRFYEIGMLGQEDTEILDAIPGAKEKMAAYQDALDNNEGKSYVDFNETEEGVYELADNRNYMDKLTVFSGSIATSKPLSYKYVRDSKESSAPLRFADIVRKWFSGFFTDTKPQSTPEDTVNNANIVTISRKDADAINREQDFPIVKPGFTYIEINNTAQENASKGSKKQYIELKSRVINADTNNRSNLIHFHKIINPIRKFIAGNKELEKMISKFMTPEMLAIANKIETNRFELGHPLYNKMVRELADNVWNTHRNRTTDGSVNKDVQALEEARSAQLEADPNSAAAINLEFDTKIADLIENVPSSYTEDEKQFFDALFDYLKTNKDGINKADVIKMARQLDEQVYGRERYKNYKKEYVYKVKKTVEGKEVEEEVVVSEADFKNDPKHFTAWKATWGRDSFTKGTRAVTTKDMDGTIVPQLNTRSGSTGVVQRVLNKVAQSNRLIKSPSGIQYYIRKFKNIKGKSSVQAAGLLEIPNNKGGKAFTAEYRLTVQVMTEKGLDKKYPNGVEFFVQGVPYFAFAPLGADGKKDLSNLQPLTTEDKAVIDAELKNVQPGKLYLSDLEDLFGENAFDEQGNNKSNIRANIPIDQDWKNETELTDEYGYPVLDDEKKPITLSPDELKQNYLQTSFVSVEPTTLTVTIGGSQPSAATPPVAPPASNVPTQRKSRGSLLNGLRKKPGDAAPLLKSRMRTPGEKIQESSVLAYIKRFIPGITAEEVKVMAPVAYMKAESAYGLEDTWGMFADKVIYLLNESGKGVYKFVARHEVFHKIFRDFLNEKERQSIYNAAREAYGWTGTNYKTANEIEEELADIWGARKDMPQNAWENMKLVIKRFFRKVGTILGLVSKHRHRIDTLFELIDAGAFTNPAYDSQWSAAAKRKFKKHYNNDFDLANRVEILWSQHMSLYNTINFQDEDGNRNEDVPLTLREIKTEFVQSLEASKEELLNLPEDELTFDDHRMLKAIEIALTQRKNKYVVINDLLRELYPNVEASDFLNNEEVTGDEDAVATLDDILNKDDNLDVHSKLTNNVKIFLSGITVQAGQTIQHINISSALAKIYDTITNFDTFNIDELKKNILTAFRQEQGVFFKNGEAFGNPATAAVAKAILKLVDDSNVKNSKFITNEGGFLVGLPNDVYFQDENTFSYYGQVFKREGVEFTKKLEAQLRNAETEAEKQQIDEQLSEVAFNIESTESFFNRVINNISEIDRQSENRSVFKTLSGSDSFFLLKEIWGRDMAQDTLQDLMNLINSNYNVQPMVGIRTGFPGAKDYSYRAIGEDVNKHAFKDNIESAVIATMAAEKWDLLERLNGEATEAIEKEDSGKYATILNSFFIELGIINTPIPISPDKAQQSIKALSGILGGINKDESEKSLQAAIAGSKGFMKKLAELLDNSDNVKTVSSYTRADGKKQFFARYLDFAQRTAINIMRATQGKYSVKLDKFMDLPFFKNNFFHPQHGKKINAIFDYSLHDSIKEDYTDKVTEFSDEESQHFFERNFFLQFMSMVNEFKTAGQQYLTYQQQPYTISNKTYIKTYSVGVLSDTNKRSTEVGTIRQALRAALEQEFVRVSPKDFKATRNGQTFNPLDVKNYNEKKVEQSYIVGIEDNPEAKALWSKLRAARQAKQTISDAEYEQLMGYVEKAMDEKINQLTDTLQGNLSSWNAPVDTFVANTYNALLEANLIKRESLDKELFELSYADGKAKVSFVNYDSKNAAFLKPMLAVWYKNFYLNGLMLNQITAGDQAMYKNEYDEIKRMSIFHGIGQAMMTGEWGGRYADPEFRTLVGEDIVSLFNTKENTTDYDYKQQLEEAKKNPLLKEVNWTDGQGLMTMRRFQNLQKGYGPGANLQNTLKPIYAGIDEYGVNRTMKYSSIVMTDEMCRQFPLIKQLRMKMELNGLTGSDYTQARKLLDRQIESNDLNVADTQRLYNLFKKNEKTQLGEFVADSVTKTGNPNGRLTFNRATGRYEGIDNTETPISEAAVVQMDNANWRIQINPAHDIDSKVSLFTQLMYFANFDGRNPTEAKTMYTALGELTQMGMDELKDELNISKISNILKELSPAKIEKALRSLLKSKMQNMPGKEKAHEFLENNVSLNAPFMVNDMLTQLSSWFNKNIIAPKFNGSKFVLQSAMLTHGVYKDGRIDPAKVPQFDAKNNIMEVYLPNLFKKFLPEEYQNMTEAELLEAMQGDVVLNQKLLLGFRIPSTGINSAVRVKIKGFYPSDNNIIIAPPNITFQHGSDYDVDSLFVIRASTLSKKEAETLSKLTGGTYKEGHRIGYEEEFNQEFERKLEVGSKTGENKDIFRSIRKAYLKNKITKTYLDILAKKDNQDDIMKPITFEIPKDLEKVDSLFNLAAYHSSDKSVAAEIAEFRALHDKLAKKESVDLKRMGELREAILFTKRDLNDPVDLMKMQLDNKSGTKLTGIAANSAKGVAYLLNSTTDENLPTLRENLQFKIGNTTYDGIKRVDDNKVQVSEHFSWMVNAAIDNVKEQILQVINMSIGTGNIWLSFTALGMAPQISLKIMKQPFVAGLLNIGRIKAKQISEIQGDILGKLPEGFEMAVDENVEISEEDLTKYMSMTQEDIDALEGADKARALKVQWKVLDIINKATEIGQSLFDTTRSLSILQTNKVTFEEQEDVMESITNIYKSDMTMVNDSSVEFSMNPFEYKNYEIGERPSLNEKFAFTNVDLMELPHWKKAYEQFKMLYDLERVAFYKHSPQMIEFSKIITKYEKLTKDMFSWKETLNERMIRDELVKYFFTDLKFDQFGRTIDFNAVSDSYTVKGVFGNDTTVYGSEAFIQRFIDNVMRLKADPAYADNKFLQKLRFKKDFKGISRLRVSDISSLTYKDIKILENEFVNLGQKDYQLHQAKLMDEINANIAKLNEEAAQEISRATSEEEIAKINEVYDNKIVFEYNKLNRTWFSELQTDFVKYLVLAEGLRFGSSTFATLLPAEIYLPVFRAFNRQMTKLNTMPVKELSKVMEHFNLSLTLNKVSDKQRIKKGKFVKPFANVRGKSEKIGESMVYYNLKLESNDKEQVLDMPKIVFDSYSYPNEQTGKEIEVENVYVRIDVPGAEQHINYYQLAGPKNAHETYNFRWDLFDNVYKLDDYFNASTLKVKATSIVMEERKINKKNVLNEPFLFHSLDLAPGTYVRVTQPGDSTGIYSDVYRVVRKVSEASSTEVKKELAEKVDKVKAAAKEIKVSRTDINRLAGEILLKKKDIQPGQEISQSFKEELDRLEAELAEKEKMLTRKNELNEEVSTLIAQMRESNNKYELMKEVDSAVEIKYNSKAEELRALYAGVDNFDENMTDEQVIEYHEAVMRGEIVC